jgi:hypothetical protein
MRDMTPARGEARGEAALHAHARGLLMSPHKDGKDGDDDDEEK